MNGRIARALGAWEELVGMLSILKFLSNGVLVSVAGRIYLLPNFPEELQAKLLKLVGKKIGILRLTDGYRFRIINVLPEQKRTKSDVEAINGGNVKRELPGRRIRVLHEV